MAHYNERRDDEVGKGDEDGQMQEMGAQDQDADVQVQAQEELTDSIAVDNGGVLEVAIVERDKRIDELETQIAEVAKSVDGANELMEQIEKLKSDSSTE